MPLKWVVCIRLVSRAWAIAPLSASSAQRTGNRVFRFVNNNDIVPHVPPPFSIWNPTRLYGHLGVATYFNRNGRLIANTRYSTIGRIANVVLGLGKGIVGRGFNHITDHRMEYYISHLDDALKEEIEDVASKMLEVG